MKKTNNIPFIFGENLAFHFCGDPQLPDLLQKLQSHAATVPHKNSIAIKCGKADNLLSAAKWNFYKGIPWKASTQYNQAGELKEIAFYAIFFRQFLFFRIVLLPLLWRLASNNGGFYMLGSAYCSQDQTTVLFATPGAGKTRYTLKKLLNEESYLIGDGSLIYLPQHGIFPVVDEIELRKKTIMGLPYWQKLSFCQKAKLFFMDIISLITAKYISFNLPLHSSALGIKPVADAIARHHVVCQIRSGQVEEFNAASASKNIVAYLKDYENLDELIWIVTEEFYNHVSSSSLYGGWIDEFMRN